MINAAPILKQAGETEKLSVALRAGDDPVRFNSKPKGTQVEYWR